MNAKIIAEIGSKAWPADTSNSTFGSRKPSPFALGCETWPRARLLIIDDQFGQTPGLQLLLQRQGFAVDLVPGESAFTAAVFDGYHAVIVDIMVLQSTGLDGLRNLRNITELPMLVLTALGAESDRIAGLELGADDYVVKPYRPREVVARIVALLCRRAAP